MGSEINDGGPAFGRDTRIEHEYARPVVDVGNGERLTTDVPVIVRSTISGISGMSLRDYFAAQALCGVCGNSTSLANFRHAVSGDLSQVEPAIAQACYLMADAMIAARAALKGGE